MKFTPEEIIAMAREAGFANAAFGPQPFERFAALVADKAAAREREACAKVCEERAGTMSMFASVRDARVHNDAVKGDAAAIRARGQKGAA